MSVSDSFPLLVPGGSVAQVLDTRDRWLSSFHDLAVVVRAAWAADTAWVDDWNGVNPARGQCGTSSILLQDERGGTLVRGLVEAAGHPVAVHYWNEFEAGHVDLTWQQFPPSARVVHSEPVTRQDLLVTQWLISRYQTLRSRVDDGRAPAAR
jgi:hypothetical protein